MLYNSNGSQFIYHEILRSLLAEHLPNGSISVFAQHQSVIWPDNLELPVVVVVEPTFLECLNKCE